MEEVAKEGKYRDACSHQPANLLERVEGKHFTRKEAVYQEREGKNCPHGEEPASRTHVPS